MHCLMNEIEIFLNLVRLIFRCFLNKKAEPVRKLFTEVLNIVSTFCELVIRSTFCHCVNFNFFE
jgi:hypothetical protein